jgi:SAM-dependent methyltransferase
LKLTYNPAIFDAADIDSAKQIILTPEGGSTEDRWIIETPFLLDFYARAVSLTPSTVVLDYGCGIGRLSKGLIERHGCSVIGVDISARMRAMAVEYVNSDRFVVCAPAGLDAMARRGLRCDTAVAAWVLQHCLSPAEDVARLAGVLKPNGGLLVLNNIHRAVPTTEKVWENDGLDILEMLKRQFTLEFHGKLPPDKTTASLASLHFLAVFSNRLASTPAL